MMRILAGLAVLVWMPSIAVACGSADPKIAIGSKTVTVTMRDSMSPVVSQVIDDDGVFVTHFVSSYCALNQSEKSQALDCWKDAGPVLIRSTARTAEYWSKDYIAYIDSSDLSADGKAQEKKVAQKKAAFWANINAQFTKGISLADFRSFLASDEFAESKQNNYNYAEPMPGKEPRYRVEALDDIYGMLGMSFDGIPSTEHSRCGEPSLQAVQALKGVEWKEGTEQEHKRDAESNG